MRISSRILLFLLAILSVSALGYYAFLLATKTLTEPFVWQTRQTGTALRFVLAKPTLIFGNYDAQIFDTGALVKSILKNDVPWNPLVSGEGYMFVSGEYVEIASANTMKDGDTLRIDAKTYNANTPKKEHISSDIVLTYDTKPKIFDITATGLPKDKTYRVRLAGYPWYSSEDVRFYVHTNPNKNCFMQDAWDSREFQKVSVKNKSTYKSDIQSTESEVVLDYDQNAPRLCIVAGIGGDFYTVEDRRLDVFTATGELSTALSPEYDMKSRIEFRFTSDIYSDTGIIYSREYMQNREDAKIEFLKHLSLTPNVPLTTENIALSPNRASILLPLEEWKTYKVSLDKISDIYGRTADTTMSITPKKEPFLSLYLKNRSTIFRPNESIDTKMYFMKPKKTEYELKLCRVSLEGYSRFERVIAEGDKKYLDSVYDMLSSSEVSLCSKKSIAVLSGSSLYSSFDIRDFSPSKKLTPGFYVLAFANKDDVASLGSFVSPRVFSVVDSQVTMKVDASGKMSFLVTDLQTLKPLSGQNITLRKNISRTYTDEWNEKEQKYDTKYLPLSTTNFSTGIILGSTDALGYFTIKKDSLIDNEYSNPYWLSNEVTWEEYEWRYSSFLATAEWGGHFSYVVSTWNDGITGWNFWMKDSDYSYDTRGAYMGYIHTDRKLYLPWETVNIHALIRKNDTSLTVPKWEKFHITLSDSNWQTVLDTVVSANEFGTLATSFDIPKSAPLGSWSLSVSPFDSSLGYIENSYTNFQVEIFKNPTFTAEVKLQSPDIENDVLRNIREKQNTDPNMPWYSSIYQWTFALEWIVKAHYYNGAEMKNIPFRYRIYRNEYYDNSYWNDCFWWCYWQPTPEFYTEWTGSIGSDGFGFFRIPVDFSSFYADYSYTAEIIVSDPLSWEEVTTPATLLVKMPMEYKTYSYDNPLEFTPNKKIVTIGESIEGTLQKEYGKKESIASWAYIYEVISRTFSSVKMDDLRLEKVDIPVSRDTVVLSWTVSRDTLSISTKTLTPGEYHIRIIPKTREGIIPPESSISETVVYISGDTGSSLSRELRVIPDKTVYNLWEKARILINSPFSWGYLYITQERWGVIQHEYVALSGSTLLREYTVDDTMIPNIYIGAIAFPNTNSPGARNYAVGYGEIITDVSLKKWNITISPDKEVYTNRENASLSFSLKSKDGKPLEWELAVMVVDESLIRLLGNIDLDIIPKFYRKFPFTMKTSLTAIGMERNRFLSRKWANGWSGDKWGGGVEIASRTLFKNTAYYNPSVRTDKNGNASINFTTPDNTTEYRVIVIWNTKSSIFAVSEKTIRVQRAYTIDTHAPQISYAGDTTSITASIFNSTKNITSANLSFQIGTWSSTQKQERSIILWVNESKSITFPLSISSDWNGAVPYTLTLKKWDEVLDSITKTVLIPRLPLLGKKQRIFGSFTGTLLNIKVPTLQQGSDSLRSTLSLTLSRTPFTNTTKIIESLVSYPYGCIEQTISSTLPNTIALKFSKILGISLDKTQAEKNQSEWLTKILRMQQGGGWKYWESDSEVNAHVTPYVLRMLFAFRDFWATVPQESIDAWVQYLLDIVDGKIVVSYDTDDFRADIFYTLAQAKNPRALEVSTKIDTKKLSRHGYLVYAYGMFKISKLNPQISANLEKIMKTRDDSYWYWGDSSDDALYARFLLDIGNEKQSMMVLSPLLRNLDMSSYFTPTQTKIQVFLTLLRYHELHPLSRESVNFVLRSWKIIANMPLDSWKAEAPFVTSRSKLADTLSLEKTSTDAFFYEVLTQDIPLDIYNTSPEWTHGMKVERKFYQINESKGIDESWNFISRTPIIDGKFKKWWLYQVELIVTPPNDTRDRYYLTLEDFFPGAYRPIISTFKTESVMARNTWDWWSHIESKEDRLLATLDYVYSNEPRKYIYYFRPEYIGTYMLPPSTAYYMYEQEVYAIGKYEKIEVSNP
jgi:uncharacterized protein YfaS (alpha-2-macroglobulin family)